jgi:predicted O-methyltransferase YrrM
MIPSIRPREIFKLVEDKFPNRNIEMVMNIPPSGIGSLFSLESALLVALMKVIDPKAVFEFGTYNGNGALLFARNTRSDAVITTLNLPPKVSMVATDPA